MRVDTDIFCNIVLSSFFSQDAFNMPFYRAGQGREIAGSIDDYFLIFLLGSRYCFRRLICSQKPEVCLPFSEFFLSADVHIFV